MNTSITTIDAYLADFPVGTQALLQQMRSTIAKAAPKAEEAISYGMPTFKLEGNLVHFAGYKNHIGFYPAPSGIDAFADELKKYKTSKGAIQFPVDEKLPLALVTKIVKFRVKENMEKAAAKKSSK
ncbi:MAG: iron chaperone [Lacibacter sp.]